MLTSRTDSLKSLKLNFQKCKIATCPRLRRISICGLSDFCKIHQAYFFLVRLKYSMKKNFRTLNTSFAVLKKHSGEYCSLKDFCNIMNFINIPLMLEDVQNAFEVLSKSSGFNNTTVIKVDDMKKKMKAKDCKEIIEIEILIILEVVFKQIRESSIEHVMSLLDDDNDRQITSRDFLRVFMIRESQANLFFDNVFQKSQISLPRFFNLFSKTKKLSLEVLKVDPGNPEINFFSPRDLKPEIKKSPKFTNSDSLLENLREKLRLTFTDMSEAFKYYSNANSELGFFQVQRMLIDFGHSNDEKTCQSVLFAISNSHTIHFKEFKEYWCGRRDLCIHENCIRTSNPGETHCSLHISLTKKKALVLLEKVKSQTSIWTSPKKRLKFYNSLEKASSKHDLATLRSQLTMFLPLAELQKSNLESLHSIIGKIN